MTELCAQVHTANEVAAEPEKVTWPPILGLFKSVVVALTYLRRNRIQAEIGEAFGVSQPTISRAIKVITPLLDKALRLYVPTADELDDKTQYVVDGTLLPCWSWASHPRLLSGKHKTTGMNVQVAATLGGRLAWISDPIGGSRHDNHCLAEAAVLTGMDAGNWMGDKGHGAPRGVLSYSRFSREEFGGMFLGLMPYPEPKGIREQQHGSKSVIVSRRMERGTEGPV